MEGAFFLFVILTAICSLLSGYVKRNLRRFPDDFMFQITKEEWNALRSQIVTLEDLKSQNVISNSVDEDSD